MYVVVVSKTTDDVVLVVFRTVASSRVHPYTRNLDGPENSSNDQCHAHDNCNFVLSAGAQAYGRSHHQSDSLHIHTHPRRNPHRRLDRRKNCAACSHSAVALTMNFCFDSHWQQSRSIRWSYIWEKTRRVGRTHSLQMYVGSDVEMKVALCIRTGLQKGIQPEKELR
jgi:hypothetical protein